MSGGAMHQATRALCNVCGRLTDAKIVFRGGEVHLVKWCAEHGETSALVSTDREWYLRSLAYVRPGTRPRARAVDRHEGCPDSCGLCPEHQQHTCVPILEITGRCDLACPICLVSDAGLDEVPLESAERILDDLVRNEGRVNMLTLSGGEPTRHPDLLAIVDAARRPEIGIVSISTNGVRLSNDDALLRGLVERDVVISLQYDGTSPDTYAELRGRPELADLKRLAIERILDLGGRLSLTVTLARGVNEHEIEGILELLFTNDRILSVMVQPLAHLGRATGRQGDALTIPDVVRLLAAGSGGVLEEADFTPLPCSHPTCFALTYLLRTEEGLVSLPRVLDAESYLDIIQNQALLGTDPESVERIRDALNALWSSDGIVPNREVVLKTVRRILLDLQSPGTSHRGVIELGTEHVKSIFIHQFMDRATFDLSRAVKCCNHYPQPDGRLLPACVRNNLLAPQTQLSPEDP